MSCKCKTFDDIFCCKNQLILFFYEPSVLHNAKLAIEKLGFKCEIESEYLKIALSNAQIDVDNICKNAGFDTFEQEGIMALLRQSDEPLSFWDMKSVKPLSQLAAISDSAEITSIIKNRAFTSYFQPIINLKTNEIYGYEALLRGVRDDGSILSPAKILDAARRGDMLFYLDRAARETALKTAAVKRIEKKVFINFMPTAIYNPSTCLADTVKWAMQLEFNPKNIVFEVVETEQVKDMAHLKNILDFYKSHGFMVALDDVGSGYSSLNMLRQIRPDIIKIDRDIIDNINADSFKQSIFMALMNVANDNNITVLAEGIETKDEALFVAQCGAHLAQGYFFAKPCPEPIRSI